MWQHVHVFSTACLCENFESKMQQLTSWLCKPLICNVTTFVCHIFQGHGQQCVVRPKRLRHNEGPGLDGLDRKCQQFFAFFPNRLTCMGFLLLSKGCIPGPHDFASVSGLASHSGCLGPHEFTLVSPLSPTLRALGRMSLHLSPPCLPLWVPWAAWVYTCLPLVSHSGCLGPHEFTLVSPLSPTLGALGRMSLHLSPPCLPLCLPLWVPWAAWVYTCLPLVSHSGFLGPHEFTLVSPLSPTLGALGRMSLHLSPPCLPLWVPWAAWVYTCLPLVSQCGCLGPHEFTLVSPMSPTGFLGPPCLPLWVPWAAWVYTCLPLVSHSGCLGPHEFTLVSPCLPLWVPWAAWVYTCLPLVSHSGCLVHLSPPCLPLWVPWAAWVYTCLPLVSHSGCLGPHEFTLVSPLSPTLGALGRMNVHLSRSLSPTLVSHSGFLGPHLSPTCLPLWVLGPHEFTLVSPLSPTLGALGRMSLHLSPPCLPLWVPWAAWVYTCLPLVSHSGCLGPHEFTLVSHLSPTLVSHTCLPLVSHSVAEFDICSDHGPRFNRAGVDICRDHGPHFNLAWVDICSDHGPRFTLAGVDNVETMAHVSTWRGWHM